MIDLRGTARGCAITLAAGAVLVAGCGSNDESVAATDTAPVRTAPEQLLLTEQEFPAGAKREEVSVDRLLEATADTSGAFQSVTVTPPDCGRTQQEIIDLTRDLLAHSVLIGTRDEQSGAVYTETIASLAGDLSRITAGNQACPEVTISYDDMGSRTTSLYKVEALTVPAALKGVDAIIYRATTVTTFGESEPSTDTTYSGHAVLRGVTVSLNVGNSRDAPDESSFTKLFTDAVDKVRKAT